MPKNINYARIQNKHDVEANWKLAVNFVPLAGELIIYDPDATHDLPRVKIGDGKTLVNNLKFIDEDLINALEDIEIPTKVSQLDNDSEFITNTALTGYATENYVAAEIAKAKLEGEEVDLSGYALKNEIPTKTSQLTNDSNFITSIPSEYITETELNEKGYLTQHQSLTDYAKKTDIPAKTSQLTNDSGFLTAVPTEYVTETELAAKNYLTAVPSEYITETELNAKGYLTQHQDLSDYATKSEVPTKVSQLTNDKNYLTTVPDEYVTETELSTKGYLTQHQDLSGYAKVDHNHNDLYDAKGAAEQVKNDLLNGAGAAYDTLKELGDLIDDNVDAIDALEQVAAGKADKVHTHPELISIGTGDPTSSTASQFYFKYSAN